MCMACAVQEESTFTVEGVGKQRLDAFLSGQMPDASRARLQARHLLIHCSAHLCVVPAAGRGWDTQILGEFMAFC